MQLDLTAAFNAEFEPIFKAAPESRRLLTAFIADPRAAIDALLAYQKVWKKTVSAETLADESEPHKLAA